MDKKTDLGPNPVLYYKMIETIKNRSITFNSSIDLIKLCMEEVEKIENLNGYDKKEYVIKTLNEIAKGNDGILGTNDDLIPIYILAPLNFLIKNNILSDIIETVIKATQGELDINKKIKKNKCLCC